VLIYLVCHPSWAVRKIAYDATKKILSSSGTLAEDLLFLFTDWLSLVGERISILKQRYATFAYLFVALRSLGVSALCKISSQAVLNS
jgi:hypothetical protein